MAHDHVERDAFDGGDRVRDGVGDPLVAVAGAAVADGSQVDSERRRYLW